MKSTEEKIQICIQYLQKQGFTVYRSELISIRDTAQMCGVSMAAINRWTSLESKYFKKDFPSPAHIGYCVRFRVTDVTEWIDKQFFEGAAINAPQ